MLRKAKITELKEIMEVIEDGRRFSKEQGINQWQHGAPGRSDVERDLELGTSYIYELEGQIAATAMLNNYDEDYEKYNSLWSTAEKYLVIHRLATSEKFRSRGVARLFLDEILSYARQNDVDYLRIDTHEDNKIMRKFLSNFGFDFIGEITLTVKNKLDDKERVAYEYKVK